MAVIRSHNYFVYILTNFTKTVLYTGVTNDLRKRLEQHQLNKQRNNVNSFTARYNCVYLVFYERYQYVNDAIARETEIKGWTRKRKNELIESQNPNWNFLNNLLDD